MEDSIKRFRRKKTSARSRENHKVTAAVLEEKIGFTSIREDLKELCLTPLGVTCVEEMGFMKEPNSVSLHIHSVSEMITAMETDDGFPIGGIADLTSEVRRIRPEGTMLSAKEFSDLRLCLKAMARMSQCINAVQNGSDNKPMYPALHHIAGGMTAFPSLVNGIDRIIDHNGQVLDNASPELSEIRARLTSMQGTISRAMRKALNNAAKEGIIEPETTVAIRDGRPVIPVVAMHKRKISGIVHDMSATGKTVFIEPAEVVEAGNRLRELEAEERNEIARILTALTALLRPFTEQLLDAFVLIGKVDFIYAKATYARENSCQLPRMSRFPALEIYGARHPVLAQSLEEKGREIIPLNLKLDSENRILIVSGPNAGGKSVVLKTVAVNQYMVQCGMLPCLYSNSRMGIFGSIFIEIGDDQSIEDDLSTYSSFLQNIKRLLITGTSNTLFLIDELGAGTEPSIGGAMGQAILENLNERKMWGVVTTHFRNLIALADETSGMINGSMLYDRAAMQPLFQLSVGHPGSSFAMEIARRTGIPEAIINRAGEIVGDDYVNADRFLLDINRDKKYYENKRREIRQKEKQLDTIIEQYSDRVETLRNERKAIIKEAKEEASRIITGSNAAIERTIREIKEAQADKEKTRLARQKLQQEKAAITHSDSSMDAHPLLKSGKAKGKSIRKAAATPTTVTPKPEIRKGTNVLLDGTGTPGTVQSIDGKKAVVVFGLLKTTVDVARLVPTLKQVSSGAKAATFISAATTDSLRERQLNFNTQLDIRGFRADEALQAVMHFIDDALRMEISPLRILHGTGNGILRQAVREYLKTVPGVISFRDEDVRMGGAGITVVEV
ncbi:MAG: Smr/MutS family protein [Muribaculaceae bacterium]|nr:Smr/MutS family protein [Muribaculaceae bacterium]